MGDMDYEKRNGYNVGEDEELFMHHVICDDSELLFLDTLLRECFTSVAV